MKKNEVGKSEFESVKEFHNKFNVPVADSLVNMKTFSDEIRNLRKDLLTEEYFEYLLGEENSDIVEIADALADMIYIINGTALAYGINLPAVFREVHRSNMSKLDENGNPIFRSDGKVLKGGSYSPPDILSVIE
jgi:predicted HAD superfamily Cof-like phosphohydrolase